MGRQVKNGQLKSLHNLPEHPKTFHFVMHQSGDNVLKVHRSHSIRHYKNKIIFGAKLS